MDTNESVYLIKPLGGYMRLNLCCFAASISKLALNIKSGYSVVQVNICDNCTIAIQSNRIFKYPTLNHAGFKTAGKQVSLYFITTLLDFSTYISFIFHF